MSEQTLSGLKESFQATTKSNAVAKCIRSLNEKIQQTHSENQTLREKVEELKQSLEKEKEDFSFSLQEQKALSESQNALKEQIKILEDDNTYQLYFINQLQKSNSELENQVEGLNQELNRYQDLLDQEKHKNNTLITKLNQRSEAEMLTKSFEPDPSELKAQIEVLKQELKAHKQSQKKQTSQSFYSEQKSRDLEHKYSFIEEVSESQQQEIENQRKEIKILRQTIEELEENKATLLDKLQQTELFAQEITEVNDKLIRAIKSKSHKHRKKHKPERRSFEPLTTETLENELKELNLKYKELLRKGREDQSDKRNLKKELNEVAAQMEEKASYLSHLKTQSKVKGDYW